MADTFEALEERLEAINRRGEETTEKVDLLIEMAVALGADQPQRIMALGREAHALAERLAYREGQAYSLGYVGFAHYMLSEHEKAHAVLTKALALAEETDDRNGQALIRSALASVRLSLGDYDHALKHAGEALAIFRETGNRTEEAWTLIGFGGGFSDMGAYDRALECFRDALAICKDVGERVGEARALNGIGTVKHCMGLYEEALPYHEESLQIFREAGNRIGEARALNDLGVVYHHLGDDEKALVLHRESLQIREEIGNRQSQSTNLIHIGEIFIAQGREDEALDVLHRALAIAEDVKARLRIYQAHQRLADAYEHQGNLAEALKHYKAFHEVREAVLGEEAQVKINNIQIRFEVEKAEQTAEIERLRNVELKQKNEALEQVLQELKATQARLIQQEKMASLGQLTAGIAHEIKNPLNFINNFSELSIELADELLDELKQHQDVPVAEVLADVQDLLADLKFNAEKIHSHGRRADDIVKGMLLHSRGKPGAFQSVDLNALLDEYVSLAYHGMRAATPDFNVTIERTYDEAVDTVNLVPHEIGRVLLNLLNNAFYAVYEKAAAADGAFEPTVTVRTQRRRNSVTVRVHDNGPGIPAAFQEKIFEPFFTTKPTGSGTGLGLSLSYDIVTQGHRGTLTVESKEGEGSTFIMTLPG